MFFMNTLREIKYSIEALNTLSNNTYQEMRKHYYQIKAMNKQLEELKAIITEPYKKVSDAKPKEDLSAFSDDPELMAYLDYYVNQKGMDIMVAQEKFVSEGEAF